MERDTIREYLDVLSKADLLEGPRDALPELNVLAALERTNTASSAQSTATSTVDRWRDRIVRLPSGNTSKAASRGRVKTGQWREASATSGDVPPERR